MSVTWDSFVESTCLMVGGYTNRQEQVTHITEPLTVSDTSVTVFDTSNVSAGAVIEVGAELIHVASVDASSNTVTFSPFGRGYRGSTASSHSLDSRVTISPAIPRFSVETAINESITGVWPMVYGVASVTFPYRAAVATYPLPAGAEKVISVMADTTGPSAEWLPVRRWRMDASADATAFPTGSTVSIYDSITPGRDVLVTYSHQPTPLTSGDLFTDSGLRESAQDLIRLGAAYRLVPWLEVGHAPGNYAESNYSAGLGRATSPTSLGRFLVQAYQLRLQEELSALQTAYPIRSHYTR